MRRRPPISTLFPYTTLFRSTSNRRWEIRLGAAGTSTPARGRLLLIRVSLEIMSTARPFFLASLFSILSVAAATPGTVALVWNSNSEPNIAGYRLHYGTAATPYNQLVDVNATT